MTGKALPQLQLGVPVCSIQSLHGVRSGASTVRVDLSGLRKPVTTFPSVLTRWKALAL